MESGIGTTALALSLLAAAGCGARTRLDDVTVSDAGADSSVPPDAPDGCFGAGIVAIATSEPLPVDLAIDSTSVYWIANGSGTDCNTPSGALRKAPKAGGAAMTLAGPELSPVALALDEASAYWGDGCGSGRIRAIPLAGGVVRDLPTPSTTFFTNDRFLGVVGPDLYFNSYGMLAMPKDGSGPQHPLPGDTNNFAYGLAADATGVYWPALIGGTGGTYAVLSYLPSVGHVTTLDAPLVASLGPIAVDDAWVYYVGDANLSRAPKAGGASIVLAPRPQGILALAVDATDVYWAEGFGQSGTPIYKMPKAGGAVSMVAPAASSVRRVVVDDRCVYWVEGDLAAGRVMRGSK